jgi:hypothetical protein
VEAKMTDQAVARAAERISAAGRMSAEDWRDLSGLLAQGFRSRDEIDILIALERAVAETPEGFAEWLIGSVVNEVVWGARPTGTVDRETASWLVATLSAGEGPTRTAARIALEVVCEAERVDQVLLEFVIRTANCRNGGASPLQLSL